MSHATAADTLRSDPRVILFGGFLYFWSSPGQTYFISLFGGEIRGAFDLGHGSFGLVYSAATLASAAAIIWTGRWIDRLDLRLFTGLAVTGLAVACATLASATSLALLAIALFLLRHFGQGLMSHITITTMGRYFEASRGRATAAAGLGFIAAEAVLPALVVATIPVAGWRGTWWLTAAVVAAVVLPVALATLAGQTKRHHRHLARLAADADPDRPGTRRRQWTRAEVLRDRRFYLMLPAYLGPSILITGFFFHQVLLVETKGWDLGWWSSLFVAYAGASLAAMLAAGQLVDRIGAVRLLAALNLPQGLAVAAVAMSDSPAAGVAAMVLLGLTSGLSAATLGPVLAELYGVTHLGAIRALATALTVFGSGLSPFLFGLLVDLGLPLERSYLGAAAYCAGASLLAWRAFAAARIRPLGRR